MAFVRAVDWRTGRQRWVDEATATNYRRTNGRYVAGAPGSDVLAHRKPFGGLGNPVSGAGTFTSLPNDGTRFLIPKPADLSGYDHWVVERADGVADQYWQVSPPLLTSLPLYPDGTVYDGRTAYYRVYAVRTDGSRALVWTCSGQQPVRTGWEAPLTVTANNTVIRGRRFRSTDTTPAIKINSGVTGTVIENCELVGFGDAVQGSAGADLTVRYCRAWGLLPTTSGAGAGMFVTAYRATSVIAEHNHQEGFKFGVYINGDSTQLLQTLLVRYNRCLNLEGRKSDGAGGTVFHATNDVRSYPVGHFFQVNSAWRVASAEVSYNEVINQAGKSFTEDVFNLYNSSGTAASWMLVHDNIVYGAYSIAPRTGQNAGCGIITDGYGRYRGPAGYTGAYGDQYVANYAAVPAGSTTEGQLSDPTLNGYQRFYNNVLIACGQAGIGVGGGCNIEVYNNRTLSSGLLYDGTANYGVNVGIYMSAQYDNRVNKMDNINIHDNVASYWQMPGTQQNTNTYGRNNPYSFSPSDSNNPGLYVTNFAQSNNTSLPQLSLADEGAEYRAWKRRTRDAGIEPGERGYVPPA